jgi:uncharacterized protein
MKQLVSAILMMFIFTYALIDNARAEPVGIASGSTTGTNYPMAKDISKVCSTSKSPINVIESDGSLDNIFKIYNDRNVQYGIIQADALKYQQGIDPKMMDRILMVYPFFSAEIHLIVRTDSKIKNLMDLQGKKVVVGPAGSGTWVTTQVIKGLTGLKWIASHASQEDGLKSVLDGSVDAEFIVAGAPIKILKVKQAGIKLVSLNSTQLDAFGLYTKTTISSNTYPFQAESLSTYKVDNIMATYAFKNQYQTEIGSLIKCINDNMSTFLSTGHNKWRDVDPTDINRIKWPAHPAAVAAIERMNKK